MIDPTTRLHPRLSRPSTEVKPHWHPRAEFFAVNDSPAQVIVRNDWTEIATFLIRLLRTLLVIHSAKKLRCSMLHVLRLLPLIIHFISSMVVALTHFLT
jgi:hypothetical protein